MIRGDSTDYNLLEKWAKDFDCNGYKTCEIGVREGLGSKIIMDNVKNAYLHVGVDPYNNLKYQHYDDSPAYTADYTDAMRDQLLKDMEPYTKVVFDDIKSYRIDLIAHLTEFYGFKTVEMGDNKCLLERNIT